jgi:hygromycin-B 4-O-kinase
MADDARVVFHFLKPIMTREIDTGINIEQAGAFLVSHFDPASTDVALVGAGAWSQCFGFHRAGQELVVRFGKYVDDFQNDQRAHANATPGLPVPRVLAIGPAFDGYYCISTRVYGVPLESVSAAQWRALIPSIAAALEALREADISTASGYGGWGVDGNAPYPSWPSFLLRVGDDTPDRRTFGWRKRLATSPEDEAAFVWGYDLLERLASDAVPRYLLHCDLINRNVLVVGDRITGVFDWGCSTYGDHLYELAWFEFWSPWYPELDMELLRAELERRWREVGYWPEDMASRLRACYLHIGLDHLAYNAYLSDWPTLRATAERMRELATADRSR